MTRNTVCQPDDQKHYFKAFMARVEKIIIYALEEHNPGPAIDERTSSVMQNPGR